MSTLISSARTQGVSSAQLGNHPWFADRTSHTPGSAPGRRGERVGPSLVVAMTVAAVPLSSVFMQHATREADHVIADALDAGMRALREVRSEAEQWSGRRESNPHCQLGNVSGGYCRRLPRVADAGSSWLHQGQFGRDRTRGPYTSTDEQAWACGVRGCNCSKAHRSLMAASVARMRSCQPAGQGRSPGVSEVSGARWQLGTPLVHAVDLTRPREGGG
jgi:hypothetical protein